MISGAYDSRTVLSTATKYYAQDALQQTLFVTSPKSIVPIYYVYEVWPTLQQGADRAVSRVSRVGRRRCGFDIE